MMFDTDVFVVGGGPAGLAAAIGARQRGFAVTLADACKPPIDKACGEGLMPDAIEAATRLGVNIPSSTGFSFRGITFCGEAHAIQAGFPHGLGKGIPRTVLHGLLVEAAATAGVRMLWGCSVSAIDGCNLKVQQQSIRARWIIGADGGQSRVRQWAGIAAIRRKSRRFGFRNHYAIPPWSDYVEIHWSDRCQFYVTPVSKEEICLVLMSGDPHLRVDTALPRFPALYDRLRNIEPSGPERGSFAATRRLRRITNGHFALIGDASGTVDAITGEGMCLAFQEAIALGDALTEGDLRRYEIAHRALSRRALVMADLMLTMNSSSWIRKHALSAFSKRPDLFSNLLAGHVRGLGVAQFARTLATLGWEMVFA